ncbi:MAG: diphosphate--fructose-6-phosphate 1-phosphotransferase [Myxococcota bacterium]|nr:diphosphate--fructose-6-phosphate 1-phosphotransferase [Myxococcota bacterium]
MSLKSGNILVGQSGGPTAVINASLAAIIKEAGQRLPESRILGMRWGIEGFLRGGIVDLSGQSAATIENLHRTPSSALGSCRYKLQDDDLPLVFYLLENLNIRYILLIGGNDTMDTIHRIETHASSRGYDLIGIGVPKTVDNDLYGTDHTPGFGSAARYVALSTLEAGILARDMQRVDQFVIHQTVGREAGWLAAASALAKTTPDSAPHIILMPEVPVNRSALLAEVKRVYQEYGYVYVVCGEGIVDEDGNPISSSVTKDKFSNIEFGAMGGGSAALCLHQLIANEFGWRGEFQVTESLIMCGADRVSELDLEEAIGCGQAAVTLASKNKSGVMVSMVRTSTQPYQITFDAVPLKEAAIRAKPMPRDMISKNGMYVTRRYLEYAAPLVGPLPEYASLDTGITPVSHLTKAI